jgi:LysR family glycine cleavage system transcriptional activator
VGPWPGYEAVKLLVEQGTPMLSPEWLSGTRLTVRQLLKVPLIPDPRWLRWFKLAGVPKAKPNFVAARFPNYELEAQAAMQGIGAALLSPVLFAQFTAQGALIAPFRWTIEGPESYWLLWSKEFSDAHFVGWMKLQFGISAADPGA